MVAGICDDELGDITVPGDSPGFWRVFGPGEEQDSDERILAFDAVLTGPPEQRNAASITAAAAVP